MNNPRIYITSYDPTKCVNNLPTKLLEPALTDICSIFSAVVQAKGKEYGMDTVVGVPASPSSLAVQWVTECRDNYMWAMTYFFHLVISQKETKYDIDVSYLDLSGAAAYLGTKLWEPATPLTPETYVNTTDDEDTKDVFLSNIFFIGNLLSKK